MNRVSTADGWNSALLDLMKAQQRQIDAQHQVTTEKIASDLQGFGRNSETLTAFKSAEIRLSGYVEVAKAVASRLTSQDLALNQIADAGNATRQAIADALASGRGDSLMLAVQQQFQQAVDGLNAKHQGRYLFAGGRSDQQPVSANTLNDLVAAPSLDTLFHNDQLKATSRIDDAATIQTGFLADEMGTDLFAAYRTLQQYVINNGPFVGTLTEDQRNFLQSQITVFEGLGDSLTDVAAQNGSLQQRVDTHLASQEAQTDALKSLVADRTEVDMAEAITRLQMAQQAVQASAQVLASLRGLSLLDILRS